jgi:hypothetical protein
MVVLGLAAGCSDDDDGGGGGGGAVATFTASTTAPAPDGVRLEGAVVSNNMVTLEVVLDGATTSTDLYAFAFDILLSNPGVINFVAGSAMFGDVLETTGGQGELVLVSLSQLGDRVVVGVSKTGAGAGNGFGAEERFVLSMDFTVGSGSTTLTFDGSPDPAMGNPTDEPTALDSALVPIGTISFDALSATISR